MVQRGFNKLHDRLGRRNLFSCRSLIAEETVFATTQMGKEDRDDEWSHTLNPKSELRAKLPEGINSKQFSNANIRNALAL